MSKLQNVLESFCGLEKNLRYLDKKKESEERGCLLSNKYLCTNTSHRRDVTWARHLVRKTSEITPRRLESQKAGSLKRAVGVVVELWFSHLFSNLPQWNVQCLQTFKYRSQTYRGRFENWTQFTCVKLIQSCFQTFSNNRYPQECIPVGYAFTVCQSLLPRGVYLVLVGVYLVSGRGCT